MKKLIAMLCLAVLAVSTMFADVIFTTSLSEQLEQNANGYGYRFPEGSRASFDPETGSLAAGYLKQYPEHKGYSALVGSSMDELVQSTVQPDNNSYYPTGATANGHYFAVWAEKDAANKVMPMFSVYNFTDDEWAPITPLPGYTGTYTGAYLNNGDVTMDADGNYVFLVSMHSDDTDAADNQGISLYRGVSNDPMEIDSWTWTEVLRTQGNTWSTGTEQGHAMRVMCGANGYVVAANEGLKIDGDESNGFGYLVSTDYGQTFNTPGVEGKWTSYNAMKWNDVVTTAMSKSIYVANEDGSAVLQAPVTNINAHSNLDIAVNGEGDIFLSEFIFPEAGEAGWGDYATDGTPIGGNILIKGTKTAAGYEWAQVAAMPPIGMVKGSDTALENTDETGVFDMWSNTRPVGLTVGDNGFVVFSTNDRPAGDTAVSSAPFFGGTIDHVHGYFCSPHAIFSVDGGETFKYGDADMGHGYKMTTDDDVHHAYFKFAKKAKTMLNGTDLEFEMYGGYGIPDMATVLPDVTEDWEGGNDTYVSLDVRILKVEGSAPVGINEDLLSSPESVSLAQNYPNPFNPTTSISFKIANNSNVALNIYNAQGQLVKELVNGSVKAGVHSVEFNGAALNSGVYFYKLNANGNTLTKKMVLTK